jgi:ribose/xylose/arabinose/galactoside ABC-type transport system permease subunit
MMSRITPALRGYGIQIAVLIVAIVVLTSTTESFQGQAAIYSSLNGFMLIGIVALGVSVTMIAGELDMSTSSMAALSGVLAVRLGSLGLVPTVALVTLAAALLGMLQGWLIARLRINSLVFTVATLILFRGAAWVVSGEGPVLLEDYRVSDPLLQRWGVLSPGIVVAAVLFIAVGAFLAVTRWGREIYAIGGAREEARAAGVPVGRAIVVAFTISAGCAGLAGALAALKSASATPDAFNDLLLTGVAAALIGGISLYGGRGGTFNVALGVGVLCVVSAGLAAGGAQAYVTQLVIGVLLFTVISIEFVARRVEGRRTVSREVVA